MKISVLSAIVSLATVTLALSASLAADAAGGPPVRNVDDLLRGMPITEGLYSAQKPNPATCKIATEALSKVALGRPIELNFAMENQASLFYPSRQTLHTARSAAINHRYRLDQILVRFQIEMEHHDALRPKFKQGYSGGVKGTIKKVEFGFEGRKVLLLVTLGDVTIP